MVMLAFIRRILRCSLLLLLMAAPCLAQGKAQGDPIPEVEVCQILNNPTLFDGQVVRFRGRLEFEFEGHHVNDDVCGLPRLHASISWSYGGEPLLALEPERRRIQGLASPILRDASFDEFGVRTRARRAKRPDGEPCQSHQECAYYNVVATYTGRFFAGKMRPERMLAGGFGHMGCCHLFVIEQVSDVDAQRTVVPDEEHKFSCSSSTWPSDYHGASLPGVDARSAANKQFLADQMRSHGDESLIENMQSASPWRTLGLTGRLSWSSPDLLTTYTAQFPQSSQPKKHGKHEPDKTAEPFVVNVVRERCERDVN